MKIKPGALLFLSLTLLLLVNACGPTPPPHPTPTPTPIPHPLVGLWRFNEFQGIAVEFRSDMSFIQTTINDKDQIGDIYNQGFYAVNDAKDPAWIDIYGKNGRTFGILGGGDGTYQGSYRFRTKDVLEIIYTPNGREYGKPKRPDFFDNDSKVVLYRIRR